MRFIHMIHQNDKPDVMAEDDHRQVPQKIAVFQQRGSGESKIRGVRTFGGNLFSLQIITLDDALPDIIDDPFDFIPRNLQADVVLDFLTHPDLSYDLAVACRDRNIPIIASGKKSLVKEVITPPT